MRQKKRGFGGKEIVNAGKLTLWPENIMWY